MRTFLTLSILFTLSLISFAQSTVHQWEPIELAFSATHELDNPYVEGLPEDQPAYMQVVFEGTSGDAEGQRIEHAGFWDGDKTWKVRFAPPATGQWEFQTTSEDPGLNDQTGTITCEAWSDAELQENPTRRGFVQVNQDGDRAGRYFVYADGTPFLWIGDTWWNWTKRGIHLDSFKRVADDRAAKQFTVGQLFFAGQGWGSGSSILNADNTMPDLEHLHAIEDMVRYGNEKGLTVWIHGWWGGPELIDRYGAEAMRRWWRYVVHRLAAYNVIWVLAGEYNLNNNGGFEMDFWNELGELVKDEDPYDRITSTHPTPPGWGGGSEAPQWSTAEVIHDQDWLDYNQSQTGHGKWRNEMAPIIIEYAYNQEPAKPIVITEPWYEFIAGNASAQDIRFAAWSAVLSGAAGHSYAESQVWKAHVPEAPYGQDSWPMEHSFEVNTLDFPGAKSMAFMSKFLHNIEWWKLEPHPEFVIDNPSRYCAAIPGERYVAFLRYGGTVKIDLTDAAKDDAFQVDWIDLSNNEVKKSYQEPGGITALIYPPVDYPTIAEAKDWLLHIHKVE